MWTEGLLSKFRIFSASLFLTLKFFLSQRTFAVRCGDETFNIHPINANIPKGSILAPTLYIICTTDLSHSYDTHLAAFADDTAILCSNLNYINKSLQDHLGRLQNWFEHCRIKINIEKSTHVIFTSRYINGLPYQSIVI